jgi:hypothetical protein|tara:strand:- start:234 stop:476 length:243 start_codon:yes stop_codon:yes gene_type:complete
MNLTPEEVQSLKILKENTEKITQEFGLIKLATLNLEAREENAENLLVKLKTQETQIVKALEEKYGQGSIDIDKGTFTSAK